MEEFVPFYQHITNLYKAAYHPLYQSFSSHVTFGIAKQKVQAAFDNITYNCPLNGSRNQWDVFYSSMTPYERKVYFEYPKAVGSLSADYTASDASLVKISLLEKDKARNIAISGRYQITFNATADTGYTLLAIETALWTSRLEFYHDGANGKIRLTNSLATIPAVDVLTITSGVTYTLVLAKVNSRIIAYVNNTSQQQAMANSEIITVKFIDEHSSAANIPTRITFNNLQMWRDVFSNDISKIAAGSQKRPPWPGLYDSQQQDNARLVALSLPSYQDVSTTAVIQNDVSTSYYFTTSFVSYSASNIAQRTLFTATAGFTMPMVPVIDPVLATTQNMFDQYYNSASDYDDGNEFCIENNLPPAMVTSGGPWLTKLSNAAVDLLDATITENTVNRINVLDTSNYTNYGLANVPTLDEDELPEINQQKYLNGLLNLPNSLDLGAMHKSYVQYITSSLVGDNLPSTGAGRTWFTVTDSSVLTIFDGSGADVYDSRNDNSWVLQSFVMPEASKTLVLQYGDIYNDTDNSYVTSSVVRVGAQALFQLTRQGPSSVATTTSSSFFVNPGQLVHVAHRIGSVPAIQVAVDGVPAMLWTGSSNTIYATGSAIFVPGDSLIYRDIIMYTTATTSGRNWMPSWTSEFSPWQMWGTASWFRVAPLTASSAWISHGTVYGDASALGTSEVGDLYVTPSITSGFVISGTALMSRNLNTAHNSAQLLHQVDNINTLDVPSHVNPSTPWITSTSALYFHNAHNEYNAIVEFAHQGDRRHDRAAVGLATQFGINKGQVI